MPKKRPSQRSKVSVKTEANMEAVTTPLIRHAEFIVDTIFPKRELHIIGGPAHGGKTTLLYQIMYDLSNGYNIFGYPSQPVPSCLISCVHSANACRQIMEQMGISFPLYSFVDNAFEGETQDKKIDKMQQVCDAAMSLVPNVEMIFLDGIMRLFDGSITDNSGVGKFLSHVVRKLQEYNLTSLATGRAAKPKEATNGFRSIDRFLGATAWTEYSSTFIAIESESGAGIADLRRKVTLQPKRAPVSFHHFKFGPEGRLIEATTDDPQPERIELLLQILEFNRDREWTRAELIEEGKNNEIPVATCDRYIKVLVKQNRLRKTSYGHYEYWVPPTPPSTIH